jgi:pilus assembly protein CpaC
MSKHPLPRLTVLFFAVGAISMASNGALGQSPGPKVEGLSGPPSNIIQEISSQSERLDLFVNTSKLIRLQKAIPKALVQNPDIAELHPRGENQLQVVGKKAGFTQVVLWDLENRAYTIDVLVSSDGRELHTYLRRQFPKASFTVTPLNNKVVIEGSVDDPTHVNQVVDIAKDFYPDVINRITVGGVQQVLLHVKVMEVSRTKLRQFGFDWHRITGDDFVVQSVSGLISAFGGGAAVTSAGATLQFGVVSGSSQLFGVLDCLRQNNLAKVLAEPVLVTVSGRPAFFNEGGEFPILVPGGLGTVSVEYKKFGTQVDFVPVVLSNGHIRLEVRPRVSEIDNSRSVNIQGFDVPGLRVREVDTGVELRAGETLAIAGLVQTRVEATTRGLPYLMELPYAGAVFRRVQHEENEIELLVMVTPELVHGMLPGEVPPCGPGLATMSPTDRELYWKAHLEVPKCCGPDCGPDCHGHGYHDHGHGHGMPVGPGAPVEGEIVPTPMGAAPAVPQRPVQASAAMGQRRPAVVPAQASVPQRPVPSNRSNPSHPPRTQQIVPRRQASAGPGFVGPTGYDVRN